MAADAFDFYPCLVDGAPASIYLNLRFTDARPTTADTVYWLAAQMREPGPHGAGTADEAEVLNELEEIAITRLAEDGLVYAGRLRTRGIWETTFYGPSGKLDAVRAIAASVSDRRVEARSQPDPDWSYYRELLMPDPERLQWMDDRRLVQILREQGDALTPPRRVDHWAYFSSSGTRDEFVEAMHALGFEGGAADDGEQFAARMHRVDPIGLDHIHDVVMKVVDAAEARGGTYDGWETSIEKA